MVRFLGDGLPVGLLAAMTVAVVPVVVFAWHISAVMAFDEGLLASVAPMVLHGMVTSAATVAAHRWHGTCLALVPSIVVKVLRLVAILVVVMMMMAVMVTVAVMIVRLIELLVRVVVHVAATTLRAVVLPAVITAATVVHVVVVVSIAARLIRHVLLVVRVAVGVVVAATTARALAVHGLT